MRVNFIYRRQANLKTLTTELGMGTSMDGEMPWAVGSDGTYDPPSMLPTHMIREVGGSYQWATEDDARHGTLEYHRHILNIKSVASIGMKNYIFIILTKLS